MMYGGKCFKKFYTCLKNLVYKDSKGMYVLYPRYLKEIVRRLRVSLG